MHARTHSNLRRRIDRYPIKVKGISAGYTETARGESREHWGSQQEKIKTSIYVMNKHNTLNHYSIRTCTYNKKKGQLNTNTPPIVTKGSVCVCLHDRPRLDPFPIFEGGVRQRQTSYSVLSYVLTMFISYCLNMIWNVKYRMLTEADNTIFLKNWSPQVLWTLHHGIHLLQYDILSYTLPVHREQYICLTNSARSVRYRFESHLSRSLKKIIMKYIVLFATLHNWRISEFLCTVQYCTVQYSTIHYSIANYSTVQYITVQYNLIHRSRPDFSTQFISVQYSIVQYSTV